METLPKFEHRNWLQIAYGIFYDFEVNQSITVKGFDNEVPVGQKICEELERLDLKENYFIPPDGRPRRKRYKPDNTIGGFVAQKMFKWKREIRDKKMVYTIWRIQ